MRNNSIALLIILAILSACGHPDLTKEKAEQLIRSKNFKDGPKTKSAIIFCADESFAVKALNLGLEADSMVRIKKTYKGSEIGDPLITFTEKAKPYLLPTPTDQLKRNLQLVKTADVDFGGVTDIRPNDKDQLVEVAYYEIYKNITPFSKLEPMDYTKKKLKVAHFVYSKESGYQLVQ